MKNALPRNHLFLVIDSAIAFGVDQQDSLTSLSQRLDFASKSEILEIRENGYRPMAVLKPLARS